MRRKKTLDREKVIIEFCSIEKLALTEYKASHGVEDSKNAIKFYFEGI